MKHSMKRIMIVLTILLIVSTSFIYAITPRSYYGNTSKYYKWDSSSIKCYVDSTITSTFSTSVCNSIKAGLTAWNNSDAPAVTFTTSYSNWDVLAEAGDYGSSGWDALCTTSCSSLSNNIYIEDYAIIDLNTYYLDNYLSVNNLWRAICCHEMGHAHGLAHNNNEDSIMNESTTGYYNYLGSSPHFTAPQYADFLGVNAIY